MSTGFKSIYLSLSEAILSIINIHQDASSQSLLALLGGIFVKSAPCFCPVSLSWLLYYWPSYNGTEMEIILNKMTIHKECGLLGRDFRV